MIKQFLSHQFLLFLITGGTAAAVNFFSRILYSLWLPFSVAVVLAYLTGMITAFILAKLFVFKNSQQSMQRSAVFFVLVNLVAVAQTWGISMGLLYLVFPAWEFNFSLVVYLQVDHIVLKICNRVGVKMPECDSSLLR